VDLVRANVLAMMFASTSRGNKINDGPRLEVIGLVRTQGTAVVLQGGNCKGIHSGFSTKIQKLSPRETTIRDFAI
jgi:hypothetical protein